MTSPDTAVAAAGVFVFPADIGHHDARPLAQGLRPLPKRGVVPRRQHSATITRCRRTRPRLRVAVPAAAAVVKGESHHKARSRSLIRGSPAKQRCENGRRAHRRPSRSIGDGLFQQAFVVADLERAPGSDATTLGCGEFVNLPASDLEYDLRGERVSCALALGFARSGNMQIELIQPVRGVGLHVEFLESNGPARITSGSSSTTSTQWSRSARSSGFPKVMGGQFGSLRFCYLDTWDTLGLVRGVGRGVPDDGRRTCST